MCIVNTAVSEPRAVETNSNKVKALLKPFCYSLLSCESTSATESCGRSPKAIFPVCSQVWIRKSKLNFFALMFLFACHPEDKWTPLVKMPRTSVDFNCARFFSRPFNSEVARSPCDSSFLGWFVSETCQRYLWRTQFPPPPISSQPCDILSALFPARR